MGIKKALKSIMPKRLFIILYPIYKPFGLIRFKLKLNKLNKDQKELVKKTRKKEVINVIFLVIHDSIWKYEEVYRKLENNPKFNVKVVAIPLVRENIGQMETYYQTLKYFSQNDYNTVSSYDEKNKQWLDIKKLTNPDVVFFTNPHKLTFDKYYINNFTDCLTCYSPYAFVVIHSISMHYNQAFHHFLWRHFIETDEHFNFAKSFQLRKATNTRITGFPGLDVIFSSNFKPSSPWKTVVDVKKTKKIIWAPHHTISGQGSGLDYSSFFLYHEYFIDLLQKDKNIQIAFKPHPLLKEKLYKDQNWGKEKTDEYFESWNKLSNGQLEQGSYIELFKYSDGMIMDSASFIAEYLYFDHPICFTKIDNKVLERFNSFGQKIFNVMYQAHTIDEVDSFIKTNILEDKDPLKKDRNTFLNEKILPKNGRTASENIYNELIKELC